LNKWASGCEARLLKNKFENLKHVTVDQIETLFNELANIENEMKCKKCTMISSKSEILHNLQNNITKKLVQVIEFEKIKLKQMVIESEELRTTAESFDKFVDDQLTVVRKLNVTLILNKTSSISDVKKVINKMNGIRNELLKKIVKVKSINKILKTIKEGKMIVPEDNVITLMSKRMDNSSKRLTSLLKSMNHELLNIENKTKKEKQLPKKKKPKSNFTSLSKGKFKQKYHHKNEDSDKNETTQENLSDEIFDDVKQSRKLYFENTHKELNFEERFSIVKRQIKLEKIKNDFKTTSSSSTMVLLWRYFKTGVPIYFIICAVLVITSIVFEETNVVSNCLKRNSFQSNWLRIIREPYFNEDNQPRPPPM